MAKPEKVSAVEETEVENEVEAPKASKKVKAEKEVEAPKVEDEAPKVEDEAEVEYDRDWHLALAAEADEALDGNKRAKALAKILEINTGVKYTQDQAENVFNAVQQYILLNCYTNGSTRLPYLGKIDLVDVPEKTGKIKTQGAEKEWVSPAHTTLKFRANDLTKEILSVSVDDYTEKVLNRLLVDDQVGVEEAE